MPGKMAWGGVLALCAQRSGSDLDFCCENLDAGQDLSDKQWFLQQVLEREACRKGGSYKEGGLRTVWTACDVGVTVKSVFEFMRK